MAGFDPYDVMGLKRDADGVEIRSAYRRLVRSMHPDAGGAIEKWAELQRAYDILMDDKARAHYDATGDAADPKRDPGDIKPMEYISLSIGLVLTGDKDLLGSDLAKAIADALRHKRAECQGFADKAELALARLARLRKRFRRKTDGVNDMEGMLDWHAEQLTDALKAHKDRVRDFTRAIEIIGQYEFSPEGGGWNLPFAQTTTATAF